MLAPTLRRHRGDGTFHQLKQGLLHTLAAHITGDAWVFGLARNFVDFVNVDDPALCAFNVIFRRLQQLEDDVFHIFADIARFGQCRRICHSERHIQNTCKRLRQ